MNKKILIITGPTATGKTELAIKLAKKFNGEIVNADSRQVYQGMDIGTGKDIENKSKIKNQNARLQMLSHSECGQAKLHIKNQKFTIGFRLKNNIPVWLVDICKPDYVFNVGEYQKFARLVIYDIQNRRKLPIIVGGTGLYIRSIIEPLNKISIPPNEKLRQQLNDFTVKQLQNKLHQLNKNKFESLNNSDRNNPRRLIRAIEIEEYNLSFWSSDNPPAGGGTIESKYLKKDAISASRRIQHDDIITNSPLPKGEYLLIGLKMSQELLAQNIDKRVEKRYQQGILDEIKQLLKSGYTWNLPSMSGLGYREWKQFFVSSKFEVRGSKKLEIINPSTALRKEILDLWKLHENQYVKKQLTFLKKIPNINWFDVSKPDYYLSIETKVHQWYNQNI